MKKILVMVCKTIVGIVILSICIGIFILLIYLVDKGMDWIVNNISTKQVENFIKGILIIGFSIFTLKMSYLMGNSIFRSYKLYHNNKYKVMK